MEQTTREHRIDQLSKVDEKRCIYNRAIQIIQIDKKTHWLSITESEFEEIKAILTK